MNKIDLNLYADFVYNVTSLPSKNNDEFKTVIDNLTAQVNVPLLLTGAIGMTSEAGEAQEIIKKVIFQGKPFTAETKEHLKKELGDIIWYWTNMCNALNIDPNEVISLNVDKLKSRYPGGNFDPYYSENRKSGDI
jgi:NTP pyrophosphatase (non-canonical NTP hydrolase)